MLCGIAAVGLIVILQLIPRKPGRPLFSEAQLASVSPAAIQAIEDARLTPDELNQLIVAQGTNWMDTVEQVQPVLASQPSIWPVLLAGAAFLYLWWLATLLFDLGFVWQRYVRRSITNQRLLQWNSAGLPVRPDDVAPEVTCRNPESQ
jgi:hypothetical protein